MEILRFYIDNHGPNAENEKNSIRKAIELAKQIEVNEINFIIHTKNNTGYLERAFNSSVIPSLFKGVIQEGIKFKIETIKTFQNFSRSDKIIVTFGLDSDEVFLFDNYHFVKGIVAHPWLKDGVLKWSKTWGAIEILSGKTQEMYSLPDKVVQNAFNELTSSINMSTGIVNPCDEEECKTYLRALHKHSYALNTDEVFAYLVRENGWKTDHAKDVTDLIDKLNNGKTFKGGAKTGLQNHIKRWKV